MTTIGGVCLSSMTQWCLRCLKWIMQWTHPSSHSFSRLVHGERSDSHMLALMLYCSFSVHLLQHKLSNEPDFYEQSLIVSLGRDIKGNSGGGGSITLNILSMQTHSWPKQNRLVWPVFQRNLQLKSLSPTFTGYCDDGRTGSKQFSLWAVE